MLSILHIVYSLDLFNAVNPSKSSAMKFPTVQKKKKKKRWRYVYTPLELDNGVNILRNKNDFTICRKITTERVLIAQ